MIHVLLYTLAVVQAMLEDDNWGVAQARNKDTPWRCECLNTTELEVECRCAGPALTQLPSTLNSNLQALTLSGMAMTILKKHDLQPYAALQDLTLTGMKRLEWIEVGTFRNPQHLRTIYISEAPALRVLPAGVFEGISSSFRSLRILRTGLEAVPDMSSFAMGTIMHMIDLESNRIREIQSNSVKVKAEQMILNYNAIESVEGWAFNGSEIAKLSLKGNRALRRLSLEAFHGLQSLIDLDLSETAITFLPTGGLEGLDILRIQDTRSLTVIPSVYSFKHLKEAWLTYSFHCCAFKFPARHDPSRHALHQAYLAKMRKYCNGELSTADMNEYDDTGQRSKRHVPLSEYYTDSWNSLHYEDERTFGPLADDGFMAEQPIPGGEGGWHSLGTSAEHTESNLETWHESGVFHQTTAKPKKFKVMCGNLSTRSISVICRPEPNALNPCEDIMGYTWLRVSVWVVVVTAVVGNLAVLVVLLSALDQVSVPKFLMCHLATADLCMGLYLLILAVMDIHSSGEYFNFAYDWQIGCGCQVAGFLTVFASQLSIFTLSILTLERWFAITYAIYLNKRLKLRAAAQIMTAGWVYAITMAALPLLGISSYSTTSICLPMETRDAKDVAYLISLLVVNGLAFIVICICYGQIYISLGRDTRRGGASSGERTVAKKMALLVFTDFACWAPIAFFGLTAVAGYPLIDVTRSKILLVFFYPLNSCANPYLYAIMTAQYRKDFFVLLSRYGFCTKVAQQYKMTYSLPTTNNSNPIPLVQRSTVNGTTIVTTVTASPRRSNQSEVFV